MSTTGLQSQDRSQTARAPSATIRQNNQRGAAEFGSRRRPSRATRMRAKLECHRDLPPEPLPAELWMQIIGDSSREDCVALCKTCRFFHKIAQPYVYKEVVLCRSEKPRSWSTHFRRTLFLFERTLKRQPKLGTLVHDLALRDEDKAMRNSKTTLLWKLDQLPNLEKFQIEYFHVDAALLHALYSHPRLRVVEFVCCTLDRSLTTQLGYPEDFPASPISELKIITPLRAFRHSAQDGVWASLAPALLKSLEVTLERRFSDTNEDLIMSNIMTSGKSNTLKSLKINFFFNSIIQFLVSCPQLQCLMIHHGIPDYGLSTYSSLPMDALPHLEHYSGPANLSEIFIQNRPVHTIELDPVVVYSDEVDDAEYINALGLLQLSSVPIVKLQLFQITPEMSWLSHLPLSIGYLTFPLKKAVFMENLDALSPLTYLRTIHDTQSGARTFNQQEVIQISEACPSLLEINLCGYERWLMVKAGVWERFQGYQ